MTAGNKAIEFCELMGGDFFAGVNRSPITLAQAVDEYITWYSFEVGGTIPSPIRSMREALAECFSIYPIGKPIATKQYVGLSLAVWDSKNGITNYITRDKGCHKPPLDELGLHW